MTQLEHLQRIADRGGQLRAAHAHYIDGDRRLTSHIVLEFERERLVLLSDEDTDAIVLTGDAPSISGGAEAELWKAANGRSILWSWILTNHQGYVDGVRFDFRNTVVDHPVVIEVIVAASTLRTTVIS
jgi:hypothetical protein